jgi:subtilisin family serine protease
VIDGGFDVDHLDLKDNWYVNAGEIPDNDIDDDENGLVDDHIGWNFALDSNNLPYGFRSDHGTAVAGLVSAPINGIGTVGTCPDCRVLPITINGRGSSDAKGFLYALEQGAAIITNSWGYSIGTQRTKLVEEAIAKAAKEGRDGKGAIIFFAMNNRNVDDCTTFNPDISAHPDVIAVSAMDGTGTRVRKSAYGSCLKFLSLTAQSYREDGIVTTDRPGSKGYNKYENDEDELSNLDYTRQFGGTSAATPILAGGAALLLDLNPDLSKDELIEILASTARKVNADIANYDEETGHSESHGFGLVSIDAAVKSVLARQQAQ